VWRARFAGSDAGAIVVSVEMPDLSTLAKVDELQRSNPEDRSSHCHDWRPEENHVR
jgi:hypothetical protein